MSASLRRGKKKKKNNLRRRRAFVCQGGFADFPFFFFFFDLPILPICRFADLCWSGRSFRRRRRRSSGCGSPTCSDVRRTRRLPPEALTCRPGSWAQRGFPSQRRGLSSGRRTTQLAMQMRLARRTWRASHGYGVSSGFCSEPAMEQDAYL